MMPQWISDVISVAPWLGAIFVFLFFVVKLWTKTAPTLRRWGRILDRLTGVPADPRTGQQEVPGLFERMDHQDEQLQEQSTVLETIRHEVEFNNGSSVKDAITRTEAQNIKLGEQTADIAEKLDVHLAACIVAQTTTINVLPGGNANE